jgi:hypothetical protein
MGEIMQRRCSEVLKKQRGCPKSHLDDFWDSPFGSADSKQMTAALELLLSARRAVKKGAAYGSDACNGHPPADFFRVARSTYMEDAVVASGRQR